MTFTAEQVKALEPFEQYFTTAINSRYARYPGANAVKTIHAIYTSATKENMVVNTSCSSCIFRLLVDCGHIYFKDKEEMKKTRKKARK